MPPTLKIPTSVLIKPEGQKEYREYVIECEVDGCVTVSRHRYNDFLVLHDSIPALAGSRFPAPKSIFNLNTDSAVTERIVTLQTYLQSLSDKLAPASRAPLDAFLGLAVGPTAASPVARPSAPRGAFASAEVLAKATAARAAEAAGTPHAVPVPITAPAVALPPPAAPTSKYTAAVDLTVDAQSADGRVSLKLLNAEDGSTARRPMFNTPALLMMLAIIPLVVIGVIAGHGGNGDGGGGDGGAVRTGQAGQQPLSALPGAVVCEPSEGSLTLDYFPSGSLRVFADDEWQSLCAGSLSAGAAELACKQMGYDGAAEAFAAALSSLPTLPIEEFQCKGKEESLLECKTSKLSRKKPACDLDHAQAVACVGEPDATARACSSLAAHALLRAQPAAERLAARAPVVGLAALLLVTVAAAVFARATQLLSRVGSSSADGVQVAIELL